MITTFFIPYKNYSHHHNSLSSFSSYSSLFLFSLFYLFSLFISQALCASCNTICQQSKLGCQICYQNCSNNNTIIFMSCQYRSRNFTQSQCLDLCCSQHMDDHTNTLSSNNIQQCIQPKDTEKQKQNWLKSIGYYAIVVIGSLASFILIVILIRQIYKRVQMNRNPRIQRRVLPESYQNSFVNIQENSISGIPQIENQNFPQNCQRIIKDQSNTCCICLDGKINTITKCGHAFHIQCLAAWSDRKNSCPLCNAKNIYQAKIYCSQCASQMKTVDLRLLGEFHIENIKRMKCSICNK